jgi:enoyl-CoA hydratase/carnithine racemase
VDYQQIIAEQRDAVLVLTLNRPERMNAWTPRMSVELTDAITNANGNDAIGAIVVTGAGRGFCAGADIEAVFGSQLEGGSSGGERSGADRSGGESSGGESSGAERSGTGGSGAGSWITLCRESKPLLAAVNGPAIGVGLTMILPFDQLVAAEGAKLSCRFVKMGLVPELASSHWLTARCGWGAASWLALSGATVLADEALRLRLVDRVVPADQLLDETVAMAAELAGNPPPQVRMIKELLTVNATESDFDEIQRREIEALTKAYKTPEHREAVSAFMEKRPPKFR